MYPPHENKNDLLKRLESLFNPETLHHFLKIHLILQRGETPTLTYQERDDIFQVGCSYMNWHDFTPAARIFRFLINDNPEEPRNYYAYSFCALQQDHPEEAFSAAYHCYQENPNSARGFSLLIEALIKLDEPNTVALAIDHFNAHFKDHPFLTNHYEPIRAPLGTPTGSLQDQLESIHQARCPHD